MADQGRPLHHLGRQVFEQAKAAEVEQREIEVGVDMPVRKLRNRFSNRFQIIFKIDRFCAKNR